jgi:alpha-2-macroglobulin
VQGNTVAQLGDQKGNVDWSKVRKIPATQAPAMGAASTPTPGWSNNRMDLSWPKASGLQTLSVTQQGTGKPWLTVQSLAAVARDQPLFAGFQVRKTVTPVEQAVKGRYSRGDVLRVTLDVVSSADMTWVVVSDPVPGGATILGNGLGRDSIISTQGEKQQGNGWPAFEERSFEAYRSYYRYLPKGAVQLQYTMRLNNVGDFAVPPTRVEAMYAPEMFGEAPHPRIKVEAAP